MVRGKERFYRGMNTGPIQGPVAPACHNAGALLPRPQSGRANGPVTFIRHLARTRDEKPCAGSQFHDSPSKGLFAYQKSLICRWRGAGLEREAEAAAMRGRPAPSCLIWRR